MSKRFLVLFLVVACWSGVAGADVVTDWNALALQAIRTARTAPPVASRSLAILHVAMYDAVNGSGQKSRRGPANAHPMAAASAAAHKVVTTLFPAAAVDADALHAATLAAIRGEARKNAGVALGESVADEVLFDRATDGFDAIVLAPGGSGAGVWFPTPPALAAYLLPQWGFVRPFAIISAAAHRPPPPPLLTSAQWAAECNEVKSVGGATGSTRTAEQSQIAQFWADGAGTETPPGHWNHIASDVAAARRNSMHENARLFALLNIAMADAAIVAWDAKYFYNFWRPVTAIHNGDIDGNEGTAADPTWTPYLTTPPFPDYVSGHSTFSGAAARVLARFYGRDDIAFTTGSDFLPGVTRSFSSFSAAAVEAGISRVYGGIHFRSASDAGLEAGVAIGDFVYERLGGRNRGWR